MSSGPISQPQPQPVKSSSLPPIEPNNQGGQLSEEQFYNQKDLLKVVRETFGGVATYASTIQSQVVPIELQMTEVGFKNIPLTGDHTEIMKEGLVISIIPLLTRGMGALSCPNCKAQKSLMIECTEHLAEMNEELFC